MGIILFFFNLGEANALFFMEKFTLINKDRSGIKVFETFEDSSKSFSIITSILIYKGFVYKRSSKPVMKGSGLNLSKKRKKNIKNY